MSCKMFIQQQKLYLFCFSFLVCIQSLFETIVSFVYIIYTFKMFYYPFWICTYVVEVCFSDFILLFICLCTTEQCWRRTEHVENLFLTWKCGDFFQKETLYQNKVCLFSQKAVSGLCLCAGGSEKGPHKPWCVWFSLYFVVHHTQHLFVLVRWNGRSDENDRELKELCSAPHSAHVNRQLQHSG